MAPAALELSFWLSRQCTSQTILGRNMCCKGNKAKSSDGTWLGWVVPLGREGDVM